MGSFTDRNYLKQVLLDFFFQPDLVAQLGSEQDWSAS